MGINLENKIIVFDEAHNIERKSEDIYSKSIKLTDLIEIK